MEFARLRLMSAATRGPDCANSSKMRDLRLKFVLIRSSTGWLTGRPKAKPLTRVPFRALRDDFREVAFGENRHGRLHFASPPRLVAGALPLLDGQIPARQHERHLRRDRLL